MVTLPQQRIHVNILRNQPFMSKRKTDVDVATSFKELEEIAAWFERAEPDLDEGLKRFERAMELSSALRERLQDAESTIKEIKLRYTEEESAASDEV